MELLVTQIAIFASGAGSNAKKMIDYFRGSPRVHVRLIVTNNPNAGVVQIAREEEIPLLLVEKKQFQASGYVAELRNNGIDFIVLAGFLWKIPLELIEAYENKIVNIHPALLPSYGGKGMYGSAVHAAVLASKDRESGITIHFVDDKYDHGEIIFQAVCPIEEGETISTLATKIHALEYQFYAPEVEKLLINSQ